MSDRRKPVSGCRRDMAAMGDDATASNTHVEHEGGNSVAHGPLTFRDHRQLTCRQSEFKRSILISFQTRF